MGELSRGFYFFLKPVGQKRDFGFSPISKLENFQFGSDIVHSTFWLSLAIWTIFPLSSPLYQEFLLL